MIWALALTVWVAAAAGVYLASSRDAVRCVLGLGVLGSAVNLLLLASARVASELPPVVPAGAGSLGEAADPLPQALVLTAIVIGFAMVCFALALALRLGQATGSEDLLALRHAEPPPTDAVEPPEDGEGPGGGVSALGAATAAGGEA